MKIDTRIVCDQCDEELEWRTIDASCYENVIFVKPCKSCIEAALENYRLLNRPAPEKDMSHV